jgi:hypothetical protein
LLENKLIINKSTRQVAFQFEIVKEVFENYNLSRIISDRWGELEASFYKNDSDVNRKKEFEELLYIDNRFNDIERVFVNGDGYKIVQKGFLNNLNSRHDYLEIYTDVGKKERDCSIGWVNFNSKGIILNKYFISIIN